MTEYKTPAKAIVTYDNHGDWRLEDVLVREPRDDELLVKMVATGVCHTDIVNVGEITPRVLGHEGAGLVIRIGASVTAAQPGDHVLLSFSFCNACHLCRTGHPAHCLSSFPLTIGGNVPSFKVVRTGAIVGGSYFGQSSFASVSVVREASVINVRGLLGADVAEDLAIFAPLGCGVQTGVSAVLNVGRVSQGSSLAVIGLGGVGLSAVMAAKRVGAEHIIAVDRVPWRIGLAVELGATAGIDTGALPGGKTVDEMMKDLVRAPSAEKEPLGPDVVLDTTGVPALLTQALRGVRPLGKVVQLTGQTLQVDLPDHMRAGLSLVGTIQGDADPQKAVRQMIEWYRRGEFPVQKLERWYRYHEFQQAISEMNSGETVKAVLVW